MGTSGAEISTSPLSPALCQSSFECVYRYCQWVTRPFIYTLRLLWFEVCRTIYRPFIYRRCGNNDVSV